MTQSCCRRAVQRVYPFRCFYRRAFAALALAGVALHSYAITDIESQRKREDTEGLHGRLEVSLDGKSGNDSKQAVEAGLRVDYRHHQHQILAILHNEREKNNGVENSDNSFAHLRYILHRSKTFAWEGFVQYQQDSFQLLDSRSLVGGGARFNLSPGDEHYQLAVGVGAYYTEEVYGLPRGTERDDYMRANSYASYVLPLSPNTTFSDTLYWQPRFSRPSDSYVYNNLALEVAINKALSLKITLETQYDSDPVDDLKHTDQSYYTSLLYHF